MSSEQRSSEQRKNIHQVGMACPERQHCTWLYSSPLYHDFFPTSSPCRHWERLCCVCKNAKHSWKLWLHQRRRLRPSRSRSRVICRPLSRRIVPSFHNRPKEGCIAFLMPVLYTIPRSVFNGISEIAHSRLRDYNDYSSATSYQLFGL